ncbi:exported hypothetical protein [Magnetospirillum molischianum DSM 120]|uniref:Uncharacterized protein n=1 Tax=Magnetospirillum molischianum DSM 120 TaxID=1150626 RepID=H8FWJ1_MAGML|nr:exported hypothetical protein [Magnetospirillum molischianum DSM 120]
MRHPTLSGIARHCGWIVALSLTWLGLSLIGARADGRSAESRQYLGETSGTRLHSSRPRAQAFADSDAPRWLRSALAKQSLTIQDDPCKRRETLIFQHKREPTFVAATWSCGSVYDGYLSIHRVRGGNRLELVYSLQGGELTIVEPSGRDVIPDHAALLFVDEASGGSGYEGYRHHILRLAGDVEDITPPLRTVWSELMDDKLVVMSADDRWANFFYGCGQCGPLIPVISVWMNGHFRESCRIHPEIIEARLNNYIRDAAEAEANGAFILDVAELKLNVALLLLQLGRGADGRAAFDSLLAWLGQKAAEDGTNADWPKRIEAALGSTVAEASQPTELQCPLTAARGKGSHPGFEERVNRFRPK